MSFLEDEALIEVDASELTREEWFFLYAAFGTRPDASLREVNEWHRQSLGMPKVSQQLLFRQGLERLVARGVIVPETDKEGRPVTDHTGEPVYIGKGRIVSRVQHHIDPKKIITN